jgi:hypothetical protein
MTPDFSNHPKAKPVVRNGISPETLTANGVRRVGADEADHLCGLAASGIWIPYHKPEGEPIREDNREFGRLRLHDDLHGRRYRQAGSAELLHLLRLKNSTPFERSLSRPRRHLTVPEHYQVARTSRLSETFLQKSILPPRVTVGTGPEDF